MPIQSSFSYSKLRNNPNSDPLHDDSNSDHLSPLIDPEIQASNAGLEPDYRRRTKRLAIGAGLVVTGSLVAMGCLIYAVTQSNETVQTQETYNYPHESLYYDSMDNTGFNMTMRDAMCKQQEYLKFWFVCS